MTWTDFLLAGLAAVAAGLVNALAGGGTLITFPTLTALGVSAVVANVTNTVALCPGYIGGIMGQWNDLRGQMKRLWLVAPAGIIGGLIGGYLLNSYQRKTFSIPRAVSNIACIGFTRHSRPGARLACQPRESKKNQQ